MPLPNTYLQARHVIADPRGRQQEIVTWWIPQFAEPVVDLNWLKNAADDLSDIIAPPLKAAISGQSEYQGTFMRSSQGGVIFSTRTFVNHGVGTVAADPLPPQNAVVIRKFAGVPGRPGFGRWFIPSVPETFALDDFLSVVAEGVYNALGNALAGVQTLNGTPFNPAHRSRKNNTLLPILAHDVDLYIASQDRRAFRSLL